MREMIIKEWIDSWYDPSWDSFASIFDNEAYYSESWGPEYFGIGEIKKWFLKWHTHSKLERWEIKSMLHIDNHSVVEWNFCCSDKSSINEFDGVSIIEWSTNDKILSLKEFSSVLPKHRVLNL